MRIMILIDTSLNSSNPQSNKKETKKGTKLIKIKKMEKILVKFGGNRGLLIQKS